MNARITSLFVLTAGPTLALSAPTIDFWFGTSQWDSTPLTSKLIGLEGSQFTTSIWMQTLDGAAPTAMQHFAVQLFLTMDRYQDGSLLDNKIDFDPATAGVARNPVYTFFGGLAEKHFPEGAPPHVWGLDAFMTKADISENLIIEGSTSPVWLADFRLTNIGLGYGHSHTLRLENMSWFGSYFARVDGLSLYDDVAAELQVNAVPEPATIVALGLGAAALLRRRRK